MTEQDKINELKLVQDKIKKLCDEHPNLGFFVVVNAQDYGLGTKFSGNECPVCAIEVAISWAEDKQIRHNGRMSHNN